MKRRVFAAALIVTLLLLAVSASADFGGFSGGGSSRRHRSSSKSSKPSKPWSEQTTEEKIWTSLGYTAAGGGCLYILWLPIDWVIRKRRIAKYKKEHPGFDQKSIEAYVESLYYKMQAVWTDKDLSPLKDSMTEEFYERMDNKLEFFRQRGETDHTGAEVKSSSLRDARQNDGMDYLTVSLSADIVSYVTDDTTMHIVSGSSSKTIKMDYLIKLSRPSNMTTFDKDNSGWKVCDMSGQRRKKR